MEIQHRQATIDWQQKVREFVDAELIPWDCLLYTSPSPRD